MNRILFLEDDVRLGLRVRAALEAEPWSAQVVHVTDGDEAERELRSSKVDVFITDCMHPGADIELLCSLAGDKHVYTIVFSASVYHQDKERLQRINSLGLAAILDKPFELEILREHVRVGLGLRK